MKKVSKGEPAYFRRTYILIDVSFSIFLDLSTSSMVTLNEINIPVYLRYVTSHHFEMLLETSYSIHPTSNQMLII